MGNRAGGRRTGPKCIAIVGPFASGKTTLLEAILARTGAIPRQNPVSSGNTVSRPFARGARPRDERRGDLRDHRFHGRQLTFVDCPGSIEFSFEAEPVLAGLRSRRGRRRGRREEDPGSAADHAQARRSRRAAHPVPQQGRQGDGRRARHAEDAAAGKLACRCCCARFRCARTASSSARSIWRWSAPTSSANIAESEVAEIPDDEKARELEARFSMLETLADHDDQLMEQLLEEIEPPQGRDLRRPRRRSARRRR